MIFSTRHVVTVIIYFIVLTQISLIEFSFHKNRHSIKLGL
jgi:hypothetical protein